MEGFNSKIDRRNFLRLTGLAAGVAAASGVTVAAGTADAAGEGACALAAGPVRYQADDLARSDFAVPSEPGIDVFVREVRAGRRPPKTPVLMLHGARVPGVASFDLDVEGGSLAADLARAGHAVYVLDGRGYGGSTRPPQMEEPREANPPLVRTDEVVRDVAAAVEWVRGRTKMDKVALFGWATGGTWLGHYASLRPERVGHLVTYNTLFGATPNESVGSGSGLEDPENPGRFNEAEYGAYRFNTGESLLPSWDESIPSRDKSEWRDPAVADAYVQAALASDPTSGSRRPASFRSPSGALEDSYYLGIGRQLWDGSLVRARVLMVRSELDFWSVPGDPERLERQLVRAQEVRKVVIPDATHYAHLDRPERGRARLIDEVTSFLRSTG